MKTVTRSGELDPALVSCWPGVHLFASRTVYSRTSTSSDPLLWLGKCRGLSHPFMYLSPECREKGREVSNAEILEQEVSKLRPQILPVLQ
jgi:hypothetical protein